MYELESGVAGHGLRRAAVGGELMQRGMAVTELIVGAGSRVEWCQGDCGA